MLGASLPWAGLFLGLWPAALCTPTPLLVREGSLSAVEIGRIGPIGPEALSLHRPPAPQAAVAPLWSGRSAMWKGRSFMWRWRSLMWRKYRSCGVGGRSCGGNIVHVAGEVAHVAEISFMWRGRSFMWRGWSLMWRGWSLMWRGWSLMWSGRSFMWAAGAGVWAAGAGVWGLRLRKLRRMIQKLALLYCHWTAQANFRKQHTRENYSRFQNPMSPT